MILLSYIFTHHHFYSPYTRSFFPPYHQLVPFHLLCGKWDINSTHSTSHSTLFLLSLSWQLFFSSILLKRVILLSFSLFSSNLPKPFASPRLQLLVLSFLAVNKSFTSLHTWFLLYFYSLSHSLFPSSSLIFLLSLLTSKAGPQYPTGLYEYDIHGCKALYPSLAIAVLPCAHSQKLHLTQWQW